MTKVLRICHAVISQRHKKIPLYMSSKKYIDSATKSFKFHNKLHEAQPILHGHDMILLGRIMFYE